MNAVVINNPPGQSGNAGPTKPSGRPGRVQSPVEDAIRAIVTATAGSGEDFFRALVAELARVLGMKCAFVGALLPGGPERVRTVAMWAGGKVVPNCEYALAETPCANVVGRSFCHYPDGVQARFPRDKLLADMGAESYLGIPLFSAAGSPLGLLCVLDDKALPNSELAESLMRILAERAASELERQAAIDALEASEAKYRQLHNSMMDACAAVDMRGRFTDWNESFRQLLGYEPEELQALTYRDITPERWHELEAQIIANQVLRRGYSDIYEKEYRRKDGTVFPVELRAILLRDDAGQPCGMWAIVRDITERRRTREALQRQLAFDALISGLLTRFASCTGAEIDEHIRTSLQELARFIGVEYAFVALVSKDLTTWSATHGWSAPGFPSWLAQYQQVPMGTFAWIEQLLRAGQVLQIHTLDDFPPEAAAIRRRYESQGFKSTLQVPLRGRGGLIEGCLGLFSVSGGASWTSEDVQRLKMVSEAIANALERKRAEEALRESEKRLRFFFEQQLVGMAITSPAKRWVEVNDEFCRMLGYSRAELEKLTWVELTYPEDRTADLEVFNRLMAGQINDYSFEKRYLRKDGAVVHGKIRVGCVRRPDGSVFYMLALVEDITERKRAERLLAGEKQVLEGVARRLPLTEVLDKLCRLIDELSPGTMSSILLLDADEARLWPAAGPNLPEAWCRAITPMAIGPCAGSCGTAAWRKEPVIVSDLATDPLWAACAGHRDLALSLGLRACWSTPVFSAAGQLLGAFALYYPEPRRPAPWDAQLIEHVTHLASVALEHDRAAEALRQSEARYRTLFQSAQDAIILDERETFVDCNPVTLRMFGCRREEFIGQNPMRFSPALQPDGRDSAQKARERINAAYAGIPQFFEWRHCRLDGSEFDAEVSLNRLELAEQPMLLAIVRDITARKQAEEALRRAHDELEQRVRERTAELVRANERLQELDRLKSQFLATMSHELRTPLNSIIGFTAILRRGFAGPINHEQAKQLDLVSNSAQHLLALINDLLDLSRIEARKVELEQQPFNFLEVIAEAVQVLTPMAAQKNLRLVVEPGERLPNMVGDRKRCLQVLLNLVNNALKFTERGEVRITARTEGDHLRVCVADTGIGIKPEQMGMLFEAFRQLDSSARRKYEGTGLGLHLCRKLLGLMGGQISVESEFGKGSRFTFTVPLQPSQPRNSQRQAHSTG